MANLVIPDDGTIGSTSDTDAISISSSGAVTLSSDFVPATPLSHRNMIINGAMNISQRGTSFTGVGDTTKTYSVDRFCYMFGYGTPAQRMTLTQTATGSSTIGFDNSLKVDCTTVESNLGSNTSRYSGIFQLIEEQNLQHLLYGSSSAKTMTLSFYVKSSLTGTHGISVFINNGGAVLPQTYTVNTADTWERKTVSIAGNTSTAISTDPGMAIGFLLNTGTAQTSGTQNTWGTKVASTTVANLMADTSYELSITGVQLELGSVATPFEHRSYGDELQRCKRYYQLVASKGTSGKQDLRWQGLSCHIFSATRAFFAFQLDVDMRAQPTVNFVNPNFDIVWNNTSKTITSQPSNYYPTSVYIGVDLPNGGTNNVVGYGAHVDIGGNCYIEATAEL